MVRYIAQTEEDFHLLQTPPVAYLTLLVAGQPGYPIPLRQDLRLGRSIDNTLALADKKISRRHAQVELVGRSVILTDQGSTNGTYVNGRRIGQPTRLKENDRIQLGDLTFIFSQNLPQAETRAQPISPVAGTGQPTKHRPGWVTMFTAMKKLSSKVH